MKPTRKLGFVYLWWDTSKNKYYLGSHVGDPNDGYTGSNSRFKNAYNKRPNAFRRKIIQTIQFENYSELQKLEEAWLSLIHDHELHGIKYYNEKKLAAGGDIISKLTPEKRQYHKIKSQAASIKYWNELNSNEKNKIMTSLNKTRRTKWTIESAVKNSIAQPNRKHAVIIKDDCQIEIDSVRKWCSDIGINYGNMKSVLRGERESCQGYRGYYV